MKYLVDPFKGLIPIEERISTEAFEIWKTEFEKSYLEMLDRRHPFENFILSRMASRIEIESLYPVLP